MNGNKEDEYKTQDVPEDSVLMGIIWPSVRSWRPVVPHHTDEAATGHQGQDVQRLLVFSARAVSRRELNAK